MAEDFAKKGWQFAQRQQQRTGHPPRPATTPRQFSTIAAPVGPLPSQSTVNRSRSANTYSYSCGANDGPLMALITGDTASFPPRLSELRKSLVDFIGEHIVPNERAVLDHQLSSDRWTPLPLMEQMKVSAHLCVLPSSCMRTCEREENHTLPFLVHMYLIPRRYEIPHPVYISLYCTEYIQIYLTTYSLVRVCVCSLRPVLGDCGTCSCHWNQILAPGTVPDCPIWSMPTSQR